METKQLKNVEERCSIQFECFVSTAYREYFIIKVRSVSSEISILNLLNSTNPTFENPLKNPTSHSAKAGFKVGF